MRTATREFPPQRRSGAAANFEGFAPLAGNLEDATSAIARLDAVLTGHPLAAAWGWRSRLDAVRGQAAADGRLIDAWHLAAVVEGVRMDGAITIIDRGALFDAARHAFALWSRFTRPDAGQAQAIEQATGVLAASQMASPLLGAAKAVRGRAGASASDAPPEADYAASCDVQPSRRPSLVLTPLQCSKPTCWEIMKTRKQENQKTGKPRRYRHRAKLEPLRRLHNPTVRS